MKAFIKNIKTSIGGSKKTLLIALGIFLVVMAVLFLFDSEPTVNPSTVTTLRDMRGTVQGANPLAPEYRKQVEKADQKRIEDALATGGTALPTIIAGDTHEAVLPLDIEEEVPPLVLEEPEEETEVKNAAQPDFIFEPDPQQHFASPVQKVSNPEDIGRIEEYLRTLTTNAPVASVETVYSGTYYQDLEQASAEDTEPSSPRKDEDEPQVSMPLAGTVLYGQLISRANSDTPGPVLATILQGPLAGSRLIGSFTLRQNTLVIDFQTVAVKQYQGREINKTFPVNAVAVDTKYIGTGLATKVNRHLAQKIGFTFLSGLAQGIGSAISQNGSTTTVRSDGSVTTSTSDLNTTESLLSASGQAVSQTGQLLMSEYGSRPTTVIVEAGTQLGVLFY
ncbi:DotG/IcmE/VirB10 family protein [Flexibacterium corallicola]|uniref:DotG/IcmE/VirB10 family protein n=1 Tax=Flexibacterium corallicola TaxID=3037259 RepID=UPI00286EFB74|nr:DotG/IcmE/VirB10 family protein [Pseudovibrio sp. M1P-2-3]